VDMRILEKLIEYQGREYSVKAAVDYVWVDDSFDHAFGTEFCGHYEVADLEVLECTDENGEEVNIKSTSDFYNFLLEYFEEV